MKKIFITLFVSFFSLAVIAQNDMTKAMEGTELNYNYTGGNAYNVKLTTEGLSYQFLAGSKPEKWWGPFEYKAMSKDKGEYIISWFEDGFGDHVTLIVDFEKRQLFGSALVFSKKGVYKHLQMANIKSFKAPFLEK